MSGLRSRTWLPRFLTTLIGVTTLEVLHQVRWRQSGVTDPQSVVTCRGATRGEAMSEERESEAGAPVEQAEATDTQLLAAVERAAEVAPAEAGTEGPAGTASTAAEPAQAPAGSPASSPSGERPVIAEPVEPPNAAKAETAEEIFASHTPRAGALQTSAAQTADSQAYDPEATAPFTPAEAADASSGSDPLAAHFEVSEQAVRAPSAEVTAAAVAASAPAALPPERDGEIRISSDHPMAALYMQTPMPPEVRGNRGAGVLISVLATIGFAVVYAGVLALWLAPNYPPSAFLEDGLLPRVLDWGFAAASAGFFIGMLLLVLIVGRAGWWAYVLGGFLVAALTWAAALLGYAFSAHLSGTEITLHPYPLVVDFGLFFPVIAAGLVAREATVWFGAWIGARGRKMKRLNAEAAVEYEQTLAEVQAKQP